MATTASASILDQNVSSFVAKTQKILINGKWVEAASGKTFPTYNPATGEVLSRVAEGDKEDIYTVFGYAVAQTLVQVLKQCGDDLSRENVMKQAQSLKDFRSSVTLPGIAITTSPTDFRPVKEMRLVQFDGRTWQPIGQLFDSAFTSGAGNAH